MKTFPAALVCVLLISSAAFAQNEPNREHPRHGATGDRNVPPERPGRDSGPGSMNGQPGPESRPGNGMMHQDNGPMGAMGQDRNGMRGNSVQHNHDRLRGDRARIDRNLDRFRGNVETGHRFHGGRWNPPQGYTYRRWSYGQRLPSNYFARNFWITSFGLYGLMAPPPDAVWVRYGPDALLVDRMTGEIIRVQYGVFY